MIKCIVVPIFIARANMTRGIIIHNSCMFTSTAKESGIGEEAIKHCFVNPLREPRREINVPRFSEVITTFWTRAPLIIPMLVLVSNGLVKLFLGVMIIVLIASMSLNGQTYLPFLSSSVTLPSQILRRDVKQSRRF